MDGDDRQSGAAPVGDSAPELSPVDPTAPSTSVDPDEALYEESLGDQIGNLIDDSRNYAAAEVQYQKTRAKLAGRHAGIATLSIAVALVTFHIALLALAVGLVIALEPLITIWGAIAVVVGGLLVITAVLAHLAVKRGRKLRALFSEGDSG